MAINDSSRIAALTCAGEMEAAADALLRIANGGLQTTLAALKSVWGGEASLSYTKFCVETLREAISLANEMRSIAHEMRGI